MDTVNTTIVVTCIIFFLFLVICAIIHDRAIRRNGQWHFSNDGRMRRCVKNQWQYREQTEAERFEWDDSTKM